MCFYENLISFGNFGLRLVQQEPQAQVNVQINATAKQLERLSDEELIKIAGKDTTYLEPSVSD